MLSRKFLSWAADLDGHYHGPDSIEPRTTLVQVDPLACPEVLAPSRQIRSSSNIAAAPRQQETPDSPPSFAATPDLGTGSSSVSGMQTAIETPNTSPPSPDFAAPSPLASLPGRLSRLPTNDTVTQSAYRTPGSSSPIAASPLSTAQQQVGEPSSVTQDERHLSTPLPLPSTSGPGTLRPILEDLVIPSAFTRPAGPRTSPSGSDSGQNTDSALDYVSEPLDESVSEAARTSISSRILSNREITTEVTDAEIKLAQNEHDTFRNVRHYIKKALDFRLTATAHDVIRKWNTAELSDLAFDFSFAPGAVDKIMRLSDRPEYWPVEAFFPLFVLREYTRLVTFDLAAFTPIQVHSDIGGCPTDSIISLEGSSPMPKPVGWPRGSCCVVDKLEGSGYYYEVFPLETLCRRLLWKLALGVIGSAIAHQRIKLGWYGRDINYCLPPGVSVPYDVVCQYIGRPLQYECDGGCRDLKVSCTWDGRCLSFKPSPREITVGPVGTNTQPEDPITTYPFTDDPDYSQGIISIETQHDRAALCEESEVRCGCTDAPPKLDPAVILSPVGPEGGKSTPDIPGRSNTRSSRWKRAITSPVRALAKKIAPSPSSSVLSPVQLMTNDEIVARVTGREHDTAWREGMYAEEAQWTKFVRENFTKDPLPEYPAETEAKPTRSDLESPHEIGLNVESEFAPEELGQLVGLATRTESWPWKAFFPLFILRYCTNSIVIDLEHCTSISQVLAVRHSLSTAALRSSLGRVVFPKDTFAVRTQDRFEFYPLDILDRTTLWHLAISVMVSARSRLSSTIHRESGQIIDFPRGVRPPAGLLEAYESAYSERLRGGGECIRLTKDTFCHPDLDNCFKFWCFPVLLPLVGLAVCGALDGCGPSGEDGCCICCGCCCAVCIAGWDMCARCKADTHGTVMQSKASELWKPFVYAKKSFGRLERKLNPPTIRKAARRDSLRQGMRRGSSELLDATTDIAFPISPPSLTRGTSTDTTLPSTPEAIFCKPGMSNGEARTAEMDQHCNRTTHLRGTQTSDDGDHARFFVQGVTPPPPAHTRFTHRPETIRDPAPGPQQHEHWRLDIRTFQHTLEIYYPDSSVDNEQQGNVDAPDVSPPDIPTELDRIIDSSASASAKREYARQAANGFFWHKSASRWESGRAGESAGGGELWEWVRWG